MARLEVHLDGKLTDGRDMLEGSDDRIKIREHGVEIFEEGTLTIIPWHRIRQITRKTEGFGSPAPESE